MTANNLARQLKKYAIYPQTIRIGTETPKGYRRADFEDAWERYCPFATATTPQPASLLPETVSPPPIPPVGVTDGESAASPHEQRVVAAVADGPDEGEVKVALALGVKPSEATVWV